MSKKPQRIERSGIASRLSPAAVKRHKSRELGRKTSWPHKKSRGEVGCPTHQRLVCTSDQTRARIYFRQRHLFLCRVAGKRKPGKKQPSRSEQERVAESLISPLVPLQSLLCVHLNKRLVVSSGFYSPMWGSKFMTAENLRITEGRFCVTTAVSAVAAVFHWKRRRAYPSTTHKGARAGALRIEGAAFRQTN